MLRGNRLFLAVVTLVVIADQLSKAWVIARFAPGAGWPAPESALAHVFRVLHVHNTGVAFGMFQGRNALFVAIAGAIVAGLVLYQARLPEDARLPRVAIGLQVGGALGNLVDRLRLGHVTDFLDFRWGSRWHWPTFNLADAAVFVGTCLLIGYLWRQEREARTEEESPPALA